jgi:phenylalanyl-tRNA synthetase beta chain
MPAYRPDALAVRDRLRRALVGAGYTEVVTHALVAPEDVERFGPLEGSVPADEDLAGGPPVTVSNPLSREHSVLRQSLIGSLLRVVSTNLRHGRSDVAVFEVGKGYARAAEGSHEWWRLGLAICGQAAEAHWATPARPVDLDDAKGVVELIARMVDLRDVRFTALTSDPNLHPGRAASVRAMRADGELGLAGRLGELHPSLLEPLELRTERVVIAEIAVSGLTAGPEAPIRAVPPPRHPHVERDLAIVVAEPRPAIEVADLIRERAGPLLNELRLFDIYRGSPLEPGQKSLAWRLVFQAADRTLTESEIDVAVAAIVAGLDAVGGHLRT